MSDSETNYDISLKLKKLKTDLKDNIYSIEIMGDLSSIILKFINDKYGNHKKVVIFGAYPDDGESLIHQLAQNIAKRGYLTIMGSGFYLPADPLNFLGLTEMFPSIAKWIFEISKVQFHLYRYILPSIADFVIDRLHPIRTNAYELEGCADFKKPVLGFILHDEVEKLEKECKYLQSSVDKFRKECIADDENDCNEKRETNRSCPFYDLINIPLVQKIWFFTIDDWKMVAVKKLDHLEPFFDEFLK